MNRLLRVASFGLLTVLTAACGASTASKEGTSDPQPDDDQPVVSAAASVTSGVAPLDVEFTGVAAGGDGDLEFLWEFGDGETSDDQNPSYVYAMNGTFVATFTATDEDGDFATATVTISVGSASAPAVTAGADQTSGVAPLNVQFTSTVVGGDAPVTVAWNFGDGETSAAANPLHTYLTPGTYGATVTATDATGDMASATVLITVGSDSKPVISIGATPTSGPAPLNVAFTSMAAGGDAPLAYAWDFGDGTTGNTANVNHIYNMNGSYAAKVVVTDANGDTAQATVTIVVNDNQNNATKPDLQLANFGSFESGLADDYEPNDEAAYYLGDYGTGNALYTVDNAYIDPVDVTYFIDVVNFGAALNTPFDVDFYRNSPSSPGATVLGDDYETVTNLGSNGSTRLYFTVTDFTPGMTNRSYVRVDTFDEIEESVEDNNLTAGMDVTVDGDDDWFAVYEQSGWTLQIDLDMLPKDYDLELYSEDGDLLASSGNGSTTPEAIDYTATYNGLYFVRVFGYNGARDSTTPYRLKVLVP